MTTASNGDRRATGLLDGQAPVALIGALAIAAILVVNYLGRPQASEDSRLRSAPDCRQCGTVVAVRHSAHSVPLTYIEVRMRDGSVRTLRGPADGFSVGDVVEVNGDALTPRAAL